MSLGVRRGSGSWKKRGCYRKLMNSRNVFHNMNDGWFFIELYSLLIFFCREFLNLAFVNFNFRILILRVYSNRYLLNLLTSLQPFFFIISKEGFVFIIIFVLLIGDHFYLTNNSYRYCSIVILIERFIIYRSFDM